MKGPKAKSAVLAIAAFLIIGIIAQSQAADNSLALSPDIEKQLLLPEDKIDIGIAAITFAADLGLGSVDATKYSREIDHLADEARKLIPPNGGTDEAIKAIATVLYKREGFSYDFSPDAMEIVGNYLLPGLLDNKHGTCVTLPMLFMAVAQRLGLPVYPVLAPNHNFLRVTDPKSTLANIEATSGGTASDASYIKRLHISDRALAEGTYMRTLTYHEYLAGLLATNAYIFERYGQFDKAIIYYTTALKINPRLDVAVLGLAQIYRERATGLAQKAALDHQEATATKSMMYAEKAKFYEDRLKELDVALEEYRIDKKETVSSRENQSSNN